MGVFDIFNESDVCVKINTFLPLFSLQNNMFASSGRQQMAVRGHGEGQHPCGAHRDVCAQRIHHKLE